MGCGRKSCQKRKYGQFHKRIRRKRHRRIIDRESINKIHISQGREAEQEDEIAVDRIYAAAHHLNPGDTITLADKTFTICGIGTTGDYELCVQNPSDAAADGDTFGTAFVTPEAYEELKKSAAVRQSEDLTYAYRLDKDADADELREYVSERLLRFEKAGDNPRIKPANGDAQINIRAGLAAGVIVLMMLALSFPCLRHLRQWLIRRQRQLQWCGVI